MVVQEELAVQLLLLDQEILVVVPADMTVEEDAVEDVRVEVLDLDMHLEMELVGVEQIALDVEVVQVAVLAVPEIVLDALVLAVVLVLEPALVIAKMVVLVVVRRDVRVIVKENVLAVAILLVQMDVDICAILLA